MDTPEKGTKYSMKERFLRSLNKKNVDMVPVCSVTQTGTMELMELTHTSWPKAHNDPREMTRLAVAGHTAAGFEAIRYPFTSIDIPLAFGCTYSEGTYNSQPHQIDFPVKTIEDVKNVTFPKNFFETRGVEVITETTRLVEKKIESLKEDVPSVVGIIGPACIASCVTGIMNYLTWCIREPDALRSVMEIGRDVCIDYSNKLYDLGVDCVVVIDSEAGPDLFPPPLFESMVLPEYKIMTKKIKKPTILHMCGDASMILDPIGKSGFKGVSIEEKVSMREASQKIGKDICIIGNISPSNELLLKGPEEVYKASQKCLSEKTNVLAPGCGLAPATPTENIKAMIEARNNYNN